MQRTPEEQVAFDARLNRALQFYVTENTYKGPTIAVATVIVFAIVISVSVLIAAR